MFGALAVAFESLERVGREWRLLSHSGPLRLSLGDHVAQVRVHDGKRWRPLDVRVEKHEQPTCDIKLTLTICLPDVPEDSKSLGLQPGQDRAGQPRDQGDLSAHRKRPEKITYAADVRQYSCPQRGQGYPAGSDEQY